MENFIEEVYKEYKKRFFLHRNKINLNINVYKVVASKNKKSTIDLRELAYILEVAFKGCWINYKFDIISNVRVPENILLSFSDKLRNWLESFKNLKKIIRKYDSLYSFSTYHTLYDFRIIKEILFPVAGQQIEEVVEKSTYDINSDFCVKRRIYFEIDRNEIVISIKPDIVYKGNLEDFYKKNKEKIQFILVRDKCFPNVMGEVVEFVGNMKLYREKLVSLAHPKRVKRYKSIPDEELVALIKTNEGNKLIYPISELEIIPKNVFEVIPREDIEDKVKRISDENVELLNAVAEILANNDYIYSRGIFIPSRISNAHILNLDIENLVFFDIEALKDKNFIYVIGVMDSNENIKQWFINSEKNEKKALLEFAQFISDNKEKIFIGYNSDKFDIPLLKKLFKKHKLKLPSCFITRDLFKEALSNYNYPPFFEKFYFLGNKGLKYISEFLGYIPDRELKITSGILVGRYYKQYIREKNKKRKKELKNQILLYNKEDLKRTKYVFQKLKEIVEIYNKKNESIYD